MEIEKILHIGNKVDLYLGEGPFYRTRLEDITEDGLFVISVPLYRGVPVILHLEQELKIYFYKKNGMYSIDARVEGFKKDNEVHFIMLRMISEMKKQQRRESFRFNTQLKAIIRRTPFDSEGDGFFFYDGGEDDFAFTENISETGASLRTRTGYFVDDKIYVRIFLNWPTEKSEPLEFYSEVRRIDVTDYVQNVYSIGIQFLSVSDSARDKIARYVVAEQKRLLKEGKLSND